MAATVFNLVLEQGISFSQIVRWEIEPFLFAQIASITNSAPVRIATLTPHGLTDGWRVAVVGAKGLTSLNAVHNPPIEIDFKRVTIVDASTIEFNPISTALDPAYTTGGYLQWYTPASLIGCTAVFRVQNPSRTVTYLTDANPPVTVTLDNAEKTVTIAIDKTVTQSLTFKNAVYDLEITTSSGIVWPILTGKVTVIK